VIDWSLDPVNASRPDVISRSFQILVHSQKLAGFFTKILLRALDVDDFGPDPQAQVQGDLIDSEHDDTGAVDPVLLGLASIVDPILLEAFSITDFVNQEVDNRQFTKSRASNGNTSYSSHFFRRFFESIISKIGNRMAIFNSTS